MPRHELLPSENLIPLLQGHQQHQHQRLDIAPLMHHHRGLVRAACTAPNAYDPVLALASALLPTSNNATLRRPSPGNSLRPPCQQTLGAPRRSFRAYSNTSDSTHNTAKSGERGDGVVQSTQREKQKKGTFAAYETLTGSFGRTSQPDQIRKSGPDAQSPDWWGPKAHVIGKGTGREDGGEGAQIVFARPSNFFNRDQREKRRQRIEKGMSVSAGAVPSQKQGHKASQDASIPLEPESISDQPSVGGWKAEMHRLGEQANTLTKKRVTFSTAKIEAWRKKLDYEGVPFFPEPSPLENPIPFPWTASSEGDAPTSGLEMLDREIELFMQYMQPTPAELASRTNVRNRVGRFIKARTSTHLKSQIFGSETTGLSTANSDLDFRLREVQRSGFPSKGGEWILGQMQHLWQEMQADPEWMLVVFRNARYPIINAQHRESGIDLQFVCSPSTEPQADATAHFLDSIPNLKPLYFLVKSLFSTRGLLDAFNGGTGSYGLLIMLVASLTRRGASYTHASPGTQLLQFLDFYCTHDYERNGIALAPPTPKAPPQSTLFRKHGLETISRASYIRQARRRRDPIRAGQWSIGQTRPFQPYLPCIQDPANPLNDLGRKMNAIKHIVATLQQVRTDLRAGIARVDRDRGRDAGGHPRLREGESLLEPVVGRCHEVYLERRRRVEEFGLKVVRTKEGIAERRAEYAEILAERRRLREQQQQEKQQKQQQQQQQQQQAPQPVETAWAG